MVLLRFQFLASGNRFFLISVVLEATSTAKRGSCGLAQNGLIMQPILHVKLAMQLAQ